MTVSIDMQIACVRREIAMRRSAYPRWIANKRLSQQKADAEILAMEAVLQTLVTLKESGGELPL